MKYCPTCRTSYADEMNFCLNDGVPLKFHGGTDNAPAEQTLRFRPADNINTQPEKFQPTARMSAALPKKSNVGKILLVLLFVGLMFGGGIIYGVISALSKINSTRRNETFPSSNSASNQFKPIVINTPIFDRDNGKMKVEILDRVKDNFGDDYLKCLITNIGEGVLVDPSFTLDLYNNDLKTGSLSGSSALKYLEPQQTIPVWVSLFGAEKFTSARYTEQTDLRVSSKKSAELFPNLIFTNANLTIEYGTSSYNARLYKDKLFVVKGVVENQIFDKISPQLFVLYYDDKNEIVGINSTYPSDMKKGEKSSFESSIGKTSSFGEPVRFEIIAVNNN